MGQRFLVASVDHKLLVFPLILWNLPEGFLFVVDSSFPLGFLLVPLLVRDGPFFWVVFLRSAIPSLVFCLCRLRPLPSSVQVARCPFVSDPARLRSEALFYDSRFV